MSRLDYEYYLCPACGEYLEPAGDVFTCFACGHEAPRDREYELVREEPA